MGVGVVVMMCVEEVSNMLFTSNSYSIDICSRRVGTMGARGAKAPSTF